MIISILQIQLLVKFEMKGNYRNKRHVMLISKGGFIDPLLIP